MVIIYYICCCWGFGWVVWGGLVIVVLVGVLIVSWICVWVVLVCTDLGLSLDFVDTYYYRLWVWIGGCFCCIGLWVAVVVCLVVGFVVWV